MSGFLREIVSAALAAEPDLRVVAALVADDSLIAAVDLHRADVVVLGADHLPILKPKRATNRTPAAAVRPDQSGQLVLDDGRVLLVSREQKGFARLDPNTPGDYGPRKAAAQARRVTNALVDQAVDLPVSEMVILRLPYDPIPEVRAAMEQQFFRRAVRFVRCTSATEWC